MNQISKSGLRLSEEHSNECQAWIDEECTCWLYWNFDEDLYDYDSEQIDNISEELEYEEPPIRTSKTAKPTHTVDNKGIFTVARKMVSRYGKKS